MKTYLKVVRKKINLTLLSCALIYLMLRWHLLHQVPQKVLKIQGRYGSLIAESTPSGTRVIDYKDDR